MPLSIPYDPSLTLMSVVNENALKGVQEITALKAPVDAAQDALNALISSKRSLTMTRTELRNLQVSTDSLDTELEKLNVAVEKAAADYAKTKIQVEPLIMAKRKNTLSVNKQIESPVDYMRCEVKTMPLANDAMNMDVEYFSFDSNCQNPAACSTLIGSYVSRSVGNVFGAERSTEVGTAASRQVGLQVSRRKIEGTLVLCVSCTHKNASVVAPFVLHVDKAIKVWNSLFPNGKLDPTSKSSMMKCAMNEGQRDNERFSIISGTTYGSSFVVMVHILTLTQASASETMNAAAASLQASMDAGGWFAKSSGKVGVDSKFASDVKNLLSQQNIQSHVTVLTTGVTPSSVADDMSKTVENFAKFDPESDMAAVASIQNTTTSDQTSIQSLAEEARTGGQASVESTISALAAIDTGNNKILDVNSMMSALDDYLKKASEGNAGVPINYYLKDIDRKMLAEMWAAKYFPGQFMSIKYDETEGDGPAEQSKAQLCFHNPSRRLFFV